MGYGDIIFVAIWLPVIIYVYSISEEMRRGVFAKETSTFCFDGKISKGYKHFLTWMTGATIVFQLFTFCGMIVTAYRNKGLTCSTTDEMAKPMPKVALGVALCMGILLVLSITCLGILMNRLINATYDEATQKLCISLKESEYGFLNFAVVINWIVSLTMAIFVTIIDIRCSEVAQMVSGYANQRIDNYNNPNKYNKY